LEVKIKEYLAIRKKNRIENFTYTSIGMYYITICTKNRGEILGKIKQNDIKLTKEGMICKEYLQNFEKIFINIEINEYIIMPNHIHMIIEIKEEKENVSIMRIIKKYKSSISQKLGRSIWQKSYYDRIIRNEKELYAIKQYIRDNIKNWKLDKYF